VKTDTCFQNPKVPFYFDTSVDSSPSNGRESSAKTNDFVIDLVSLGRSRVLAHGDIGTPLPNRECGCMGNICRKRLAGGAAVERKTSGAVPGSTTFQGIPLQFFAAVQRIGLGLSIANA
jgi:hypothetical protein